MFEQESNYLISKLRNSFEKLQQFEKRITSIDVMYSIFIKSAIQKIINL